MKDLIVQSSIICVDEKDKRHSMTVEIGKPCPVGKDFTRHVAIRGLHDHVAPIVGGDQMQAVVLAVSFIRASLRDLEKKKYRILIPNDTEHNVS